MTSSRIPSIFIALGLLVLIFVKGSYDQVSELVYAEPRVGRDYGRRVHLLYDAGPFTRSALPNFALS